VLAFRLQKGIDVARSRAVATLCSQRGVVPGAAPSDFAILESFPPSWLSNAFSSPDRRVAAADFVRPPTKQGFTLLALTMPGSNVPFTEVTRRNTGELVPGGPHAFELGSGEFDRRFTVKAKDRPSAMMLLDTGVTQLLLDCEEVGFVMDGDKVLAFVNRGLGEEQKSKLALEFEELFRFWDGLVAR